MSEESKTENQTTETQTAEQVRPSVPKRGVGRPPNLTKYLTAYEKHVGKLTAEDLESAQGILQSWVDAKA